MKKVKEGLAGVTVGSVFRQLDPKSTGILPTRDLPEALMALGFELDESGDVQNTLANLHAANIAGIGMSDFRKIVKSLK